YNVCQHRAHELLQGTGNRKAITCPYHAWTYELDGRLRKARGADKVPGFDPNTICLTPIRLEQLCGFLFVNLDPEAAPLEALFSDVAEEILGYAPEIETYKLARRHSEDVQANWKVAVENYNECYHCPVVHPTFSRGVIRPETSRITPSAMSVRHYACGHPSERTPYHLDERAPRAHEYGAWYLWPSFSVQVYPGGVVNTYRWIPEDVTHTVVHREWYFPNEELTAEQSAIIELDRATTFAEDLPVMHAVQRGLNSRGYRPGPLMVNPSGVATAESENSVYEIQKLVLSALEG
nr:aromatic ring-hydroxylating dioxygenase subunit alpha [Gammaproteobacteria bacterium]NIR82970.1 aromatic ring-hydroxylating dioxygenase subunit alpha [Gammaproteobacteria bacterium]NIR90335.1 aromatic ring-hydroxylating dioxygenase subunit alpha [Gammaproteobacteria bacterium]NIU04116.1 aromatic ring-hydroxylating dioxygenase subunit alpha [Gammaproteobacteria bacterium]NIV51412.1 Rieske 2Fe-2S domain-containing protein [Gammaproteobacteria bacterium]